MKAVFRVVDALFRGPDLKEEAATTGRAQLVTIPYSHYVETARWALDTAGVPYDEHGHLPGCHMFAVGAVRGKDGLASTSFPGDPHVAPMMAKGDGKTGPAKALKFMRRRRRAGVPVVVLPDGTLLKDSWEILSFALKGATVAPPLKTLLDEELGPAARQLGYYYVFSAPGATPHLMACGSWMERVAFRLLAPIVVPKMKHMMHVHAEGAAGAEATVRRCFHEVSRRLSDARPFLGNGSADGDDGTVLGAADIAFASLAAIVLLPDGYGGPRWCARPDVGRLGLIPVPLVPPAFLVLRDAMRATPAGKHALRVYREHRMGHVDDRQQHEDAAAWARQRRFEGWARFGGAIVCVVAVLAIVARVTGRKLDPYGRFGNAGNLLTVGLDPRLGWWLMELPCTLAFVYNFFVRGGPQARKPVPRLLAFVFCCHYLYRGWYFPLSMRVHGNTKNFDLSIALGSWVVTVLHGYLNARWFAEHGKHLASTGRWLRSWRFRAGLVVYYTGFLAIIYHDSILRSLRRPGGPRYSIPRGGLYDYATCAQYFVELWAWFGFFLLSWGPNGLFIFFISCANLIPRAINTHEWYTDHFGSSYPSDRAYLVPFVW